MKTAFEHFCAYAEKHNLCFDVADSYGEPGYQDPEHGIILSNWNEVNPNLQDHLEGQGYACEYDDEWTVSDVGKVYRTVPDSYGWKPSFVRTDGEIIGKDELFNPDGTVDLECSAWVSYLQHIAVVADNLDGTIIEGINPDTFDIDWCSLGFEKQNPEALQTGLHPGMNDNPAEILRKMYDQVVEENLQVVFALSEQSQFYVEWDVWVKAIED